MGWIDPNCAGLERTWTSPVSTGLTTREDAKLPTQEYLILSMCVRARIHLILKKRSEIQIPEFHKSLSRRGVVGSSGHDLI